jgi:hypothetical protein
MWSESIFGLIRKQGASDRNAAMLSGLGVRQRRRKWDTRIDIEEERREVQEMKEEIREIKNEKDTGK